MKKAARMLSDMIDRFYFPFLRKTVPLQTFRYAACGGLNVALSIVLYFVMFHFVVAKREVDIGFFVLSPHVASQVIVFPIITLTGFLMNRYVTFKRSPLRGRTQLVRYTLSALGSWALNVVFLKLFVDVLHIWPTPAFILATLIVIVYSYLMQKHFTFRGCADI